MIMLYGAGGGFAFPERSGVVELVGVGRTIPDGRKWLVMQPIGAHIALDAPAAFKIGAVKQLATIIGSLASKNVIHGDISHLYVLCNPSNIASAAAEPDVFLIDFGTACMIEQVHPATLIVVPVASFHLMAGGHGSLH